MLWVQVMLDEFFLFQSYTFTHMWQYYIFWLELLWTCPKQILAFKDLDTSQHKKAIQT